VYSLGLFYQTLRYINPFAAHSLYTFRVKEHLFPSPPPPQVYGKNRDLKVKSIYFSFHCNMSVHTKGVYTERTLRCLGQTFRPLTGNAFHVFFESSFYSSVWMRSQFDVSVFELAALNKRPHSVSFYFPTSLKLHLLKLGQSSPLLFYTVFMRHKYELWYGLNTLRTSMIIPFILSNSYVVAMTGRCVLDLFYIKEYY
jgi:hypothetical protein